MANLFTIGLMLTAIDKASGVIGAMCNKSMQDLTKLQQKFKDVGETMQSIGMKSMAAGFVMTGVIQKTIREFAELEEAQAFLKTTMMDATGKVSEEYEKMLRLADKLGTELPGTTKDMLEMFIALREQGVQTKNILGGVGEAAAKFAVLMKLPYREAATYVAKFQEAMGVAEDQMIEFMDQLQRLKFASGIEVGDLAYSFRYMGSSLKMLGIQGLEAGKQVSAVLGLMAANAIEGSTAGTSLAQAFQRMAEIGHRMDSKRLREFLAPLKEKGLSLEFFTETGKFKGIEAMIRELEKLKVLASGERIVVLGKLFGIEAARPISVLIEKGIDGYNEMLKRMEQQADMQKKISEISGTVKMQWDALSGTIVNFVAYFGGITVEALKLGKIMGFLNDVFGKLSEWMMKHKTLAGIIGGGIAILGGTLIIFGGALMLLGMAFKLMAGGIQAIRTFKMVLQMAIPIIRLKRLELLRLIGVQKMMDYVRYHGGFFRSLQYFLLTTKLRFLEIIGIARIWIATQARLVVTHVISGFRMMGVAVRAFSLAFISGIRAISLAIITTPVGWLLAGIAGLIVAGYLLYRNWNRISKAMSGAWQWVKEGLQKLIKFLSEINLFKAGMKIIQSLYEGMKAVAEKPIEAIKGIAQKIRNMLPFSPAKEGPLSTLHRVNIIGTLAESVKPEPLTTAMQASLLRVRSVIEPPVQQILKPVNAMVKPLTQPVIQKFKEAKSIVEPIIQPVQQILKPVNAMVKPLTQPVIQKLQTVKSSMEPVTPLLAFAGAKGFNMPSINITQNLTINGTGESIEISKQVATVTKETIFRAIDDYFRAKKREAWQ